METELIPIRQPLSPATILRNASKTTTVWMHNENATGNRAIGTETNPITIGGPARDRASDVPERPRLASSICGRNEKMRSLILRSNERHRQPVRRDVIARVTPRTWTQRLPL